MYTTCCLMVIHLYAKVWYTYVKEQRHNARLKSIVKIKLWYWGQSPRSYRVHECTWHFVRKPWWYIQVLNEVWLSKDKNTKPCHKLYKFDLEVKGQCRIRIMNVLDTSSHGDRPMCQIWYSNFKANRSYRSDVKTWQKWNKFISSHGGRCMCQIWQASVK